MITESLNSIKAYLYDRTSSPLLGSLIVSWSAWNYKFIMLILSNLSYSDKLRMISILYDTYMEFWGIGILFPLSTSLIYLFVFPYPALVVYKFSLKRRLDLNKIKQENENSKLLTAEESINLRMEMESIKLKIASQIQSKDKLIEEKDALIDSQAVLITEKDELINTQASDIANLKDSCVKLEEQAKLYSNSSKDLEELQIVYHGLEKKYKKLLDDSKLVSDGITNKETVILESVISHLYDKSYNTEDKSKLIDIIKENADYIDDTMAQYYLDKICNEGYMEFKPVNKNYKLSRKGIERVVKRKMQESV